MKKHRSVLVKRFGFSLGVLLLSVFSSKVAFADYVNNDCREEYVTFDNTQIQIGRFSDNGTCFASITSNPDFKLKYRNYLFTNDGLFMVFNSFGNGPESTMTGAREYFFPSQLNKEMNVTHSKGIIRIDLTKRITFLFSAKDGQPVQISNAEMKIDPSINPNNQGGLEILNSSVVYIDGGFSLGKSPTTIDKNNSSIKKQTRSCEILNRELFDNSNGDAILRYKNAEFDTFVANKCPKI